MASEGETKGESEVSTSSSSYEAQPYAALAWIVVRANAGKGKEEGRAENKTVQQHTNLIHSVE